MHMSNKLLIVSGLLAAAFFGCSDKSLNQDAAKVDVSLKIVADAKSDFAALASTAEVKISADGMPSLTQPLTVTSTGISGTISGIVAGPNRKFEVFVYDAAMKLCYYGSAVGEVTVGGIANIAMTLYRTNGEGNAVINGSIQSTNTPPTVSLTSPANNAQFTLGNTIALAATAADADGSVSSVTFYNGTTIIATDNSSPYTCNFTPTAVGTYSLKAVATDNAGATTTSTPVSVVVVSGTVSLVYEAESAALTTSAAKNTNHSGYSGTGFVDGFINSTTAKVVFTVSVPSAGTYTLTTRYCAGNGTSSNTGLYINNTKIKNITCNGTSNWDTWADENETVTLNAGTNTIGLKAETSSSSCINIDKITITGAAVTNYTITYNLDGGTNSASNPASYTSTSAAITLASPTKTGYTFGGWYDNASFTGTAVTSIPTGSTGNKTYWAKWTADVYAITYNLNGGVNSASNPTMYSVTSAAITLAAPSRTGYSFGGWYDNSGLTGTAVTTIPTGSTGNKAFWAKWTVVGYVITYNLNGGTNSASNPASYTSTSATITLAAPSRTGYVFGGWFDNSGLTGTAVSSIPTGSTGDKTFYAKWTVISYSITYALNGGTNNVSNPTSYNSTSATITLAAPSKSCGTFGGWFDNAGFSGTAITSIPSGSTGDKTFYAKWTSSLYITTQPSSASMCGATGSATMSIVAPGATIYQWYSVSGGALIESKYYVGVHTSSLTIQALPAAGTQALYCVASNGSGCSVQSNNATLTVNPYVTAPSFYNWGEVNDASGLHVWLQLDFTEANRDMYWRLSSNGGASFGAWQHYGCVGGPGSIWPNVGPTGLPSGSIVVQVYNYDCGTGCQSDVSTWTYYNVGP